MAIFDRTDLLRTIKGAQQNPLRTIGFSAQLLRLNLTEEELWKYAKQAAKQLVAIIHPDQADSEEREASIAMRDAFEALKDFSAFQEALAELRKEHSEERSQENAKKRAVRQGDSLVQEAVRQREQAIADANEHKRQVERLKNQLSRLTGTDTVVVRNRKSKERNGFEWIKMPRQLTQAIAIRFEVKTWKGKVGEPGMLQGVIGTYNRKRERALRTMATKRKEASKTRELRPGELQLNPDRDSGHVEEAHHKIEKFGYASRTLAELVAQAIEQPIPVLNWGMANALDEYGIVRGTVRHTKVPDLAQVVSASAFDPEDFEKHYRRAFSDLVAWLDRRVTRVSEIHVFPELVDLRGGWFNGIDSKIVLGSVFLDEMKLSLEKGYLSAGTYPEDLEYPVVCEGALVATCMPTEIGVTGDIARLRADSFHTELFNKAGRLKEGPRIIATHYLLELM